MNNSQKRRNQFFR